jgi:hypothetical protein
MNEHVTKDKVWISVEADAFVWHDGDDWRGYFIKYTYDGKGYWDISLPPELRQNYSDLPQRPCGNCDGCIVHGNDYLCMVCRHA